MSNTSNNTEMTDSNNNTEMSTSSNNTGTKFIITPDNKPQGYEITVEIEDQTLLVYIQTGILLMTGLCAYLLYKK
jgi:hypothetical protein